MGLFVYYYYFFPTSLGVVLVEVVSVGVEYISISCKGMPYPCQTRANHIDKRTYLNCNLTLIIFTWHLVSSKSSNLTLLSDRYHYPEWVFKPGSLIECLLEFDIRSKPLGHHGRFLLYLFYCTYFELKDKLTHSVHTEIKH